MLDRSLTDSLIAWSVIYLVIALVWYLRWRLQDREAKLIEQAELREDRGEG